LFSIYFLTTYHLYECILNSKPLQQQKIPVIICILMIQLYIFKYIQLVSAQTVYLYKILMSFYNRQVWETGRVEIDCRRDIVVSRFFLVL